MTTNIKTYRDHSVCVMGLGYVGLTLATVMAEVGFKVVGVEIREDIVEKLNKAEPHFFEPGLKDRLKKTLANGNLSIEKNIPHQTNISVYIITVGTPLNNGRQVRNDMIENVCREVSMNLTSDDLVVIRSTVKIGTTKSVVLPILNQSNVNFELAFCPERTLEGQALAELRKLPQIVGGLTPSASVRASQLFQCLTPTVVRVSDVETAEMIKLVDNASRDVSFAYANEIACICSAIGISAAEVISSGKLGYSRTNLPIPGLVGGPCLEKDSHILVESLKEFGVIPRITLTSRKINESQPLEIAQYLANLTNNLTGFASQPVIAILGIAFKGIPATDDLRGTMAVPLLIALKEMFPSGTFIGYDFLVSAEKIENLGMVAINNLESAFTESDIVLITNNHPGFSEIPVDELARRMNSPGVIYDFWNNFTTQELTLPNGIEYIALGNHPRKMM